MRVDVVDPSAFTPAYDAALSAALAGLGVDVRLVTSEFAYGEVPAPEGYRVRHLFYRRAVGEPSPRRRTAIKLLEHVPGMLRYRREALQADVVHFQWFALQWLDGHLLPARPIVLTAHDLLPREPRPGQAWAQRRLYAGVDAIVVHSQYGRAQLVKSLGIPGEKVRVIHHGAFEHLARIESPVLPPELGDARGPVVLFFGLLRPYKGLPVLLRAWRSLAGRAELGSPELWIVGRPRMSIARLRAAAPPDVHFVPRFVSDAELAGCFRRADVVVLPYVETERLDFSGVLAAALAFQTPAVVSDVGGFEEVAGTGAAKLVAPGDPVALSVALEQLLADPGQRKRMELAARAAAAGPYSWNEAARRTVGLYRELLR
jgi:glycosyltransferase involved in cell wall biosynthesis